MTSLRSTLTAFTVFAALSPVQADDHMKAFPPAGKGVVRYVVQLPEQEDESAFRVQLIAGKTMQVDAVNRYVLGGRVVEETIEGWGYPRYIVSQLGPVAGTLIGVDPNAAKVTRFVALGGEPYFIRYNSRLPIVVYAPEGIEIRYRVWSAQPQTALARPG